MTPSPARSVRRTLAVVAVVAAGTALFGLAFPPREHVPAFLGVFFASAVMLGWVFLRSRDGLDRLAPRRWLLLLLGLAALLRLAAWAAPASLSDDVFRYVWDGELVLAGESPYAQRPVEVPLGGSLDAALLAELNSPEYQTVYPPLAQGVFAAGVGASRVLHMSPERAVRLLLVACDLAAVALLVPLLAALGRRPSIAALYAWNPFVYWEVGAGGHSEAILVPCLLLAVLWTVRGRACAAGAAIGLGALAKLSSLVAAPVLGWYLVRARLGGAARGLAGIAPALGRGAGAAGAALVVVLAGFALFWHQRLVAHVGESLALYAGTFSFNAPIYYPVRHLLGYREGLTPPVDPVLLPVLAAAVVAVVVASALVQNGDPRRLAAGLTAAMAAYVLLAPSLHPWYLLPVLALSILAGLRSFALLSLLLPLSYLAYDPAVGGERPLVLAAQFLPFAAVLAVEAGNRLRPRGSVEPPGAVGNTRGEDATRVR